MSESMSVAGMSGIVENQNANQEVPQNGTNTPENGNPSDPKNAQSQDPSKKPIDEKLSSKFAALSRKEKLIKQQEMQFKQQESQFRQQQSEFQKQLDAIKAENEKLKAEYEQYKAGVRKNPLAKLQEEGYDFEKLTEMQLNEGRPTPEMLLERTKAELETGYKSEIEKIKAELAEKEKAAQEAAEKAELERQEEIKQNYQTEIAQFIEQNSADYELINLNNAQGVVYDVVEQFYEEHGRILSLKEAADFTEKYLEEEASKLLKAKKLNKQPQTPQSEKKESLTLSNEMSTQVPRGNTRKLSREEEIQEVAKSLVWE